MSSNVSLRQAVEPVVSAVEHGAVSTPTIVRNSAAEIIPGRLPDPPHRTGGGGDAGARVSDAMSTVGQRASGYADTATRYVRSNPWALLAGVAVVAGLVAALVLLPRRRD